MVRRAQENPQSGKFLRANFKRPFTDLDHVIEAPMQGNPLCASWEEQGEETFRDLEFEVLKEAVGQDLQRLRL